MAVIIIGAGITGLAAAFELAERRVPCTVLEAAGRPGGLVLTEQVEGFTIDAGPDSLLAQKRAGLQLCDELGIAARLIATTPPRRAYVLARGRLWALPSPSVLGIPTTWSGLARYDLLPWPARARLAAEPLVRRRSSRDDESVAGFFRRRFGRATVDVIAQPLLGGIHAGDVEALSMRSLFPRLVEAEAAHVSVLRAMSRTRPADGNGVFRSFPGGMGELVLALEQRLGRERIRCGVAAAALRREADGWRVEGEGFSVAAGAVVLAVPAHAASRLLAPVDAEAAARCAAVPYVSTAAIVLAWPRDEIPHPLSGSGFVVARGEAAVRITACTWSSSKWENRAPAGWSLLRAFVGSARDPRAASLEDEELVAIATRDIAAVIGVRTPPRLTRVYRWPLATPQHLVGHLARVEEIERRLDALPGLFVAGGGFRATGIPDCIADGRAAAAAAARHVTGRPGARDRSAPPQR